MVSFCCDGCNETLKKQKVARHNCGSSSVSCIDCSVTFYGNDYVKHTSCVSEAQKYEKSLYREKKPKQSGIKTLLPELVKKRRNSPDAESDSSVVESSSENLTKCSGGINQYQDQSSKSKKMRSKTLEKKTDSAKDPETGFNGAKFIHKDHTNGENNRNSIANGLTQPHDAQIRQDGENANDGMLLKKVILEILGEDPKKMFSLSHIRKMSKKRGRCCGVQLSDGLFYSCLNELGARLCLTLAK